MAEVNQAIIIKKINKIEGGAHGGAWKVAYADFVTAMMAFFLLLWLLATTSEETLEGISDYFTPTVGLKDAKGIGFEGGQSPTEGTQKEALSPVGIISGSTPQGPTPQAPEKEALIESDKEAKLFEKAEESIKKAFEADPNLAEIRDNIIVEQTPEGLKIEVLDDGKHEMFDPGTTTLSEFGRRILDQMKGVIEKMPNHISITGHTDASPFSKGPEMTNWELSSGRAHAARRYLLSAGMASERVMKIVGRADKELLVPEDPKSSRNRRITIILLRGSHMVIPLTDQAAPRSLLSVPKAEEILKRDQDKQKEQMLAPQPEPQPAPQPQEAPQEPEKIKQKLPSLVPPRGILPLMPAAPQPESVPQNPDEFNPVDAFTQPQ